MKIVIYKMIKLVKTNLKVSLKFNGHFADLTPFLEL